MKEVLLESLKKYKWKILVEIIFICFNTYLFTYPAKIIGNIVDMLYNVEENYTQIMNNTYYLIGVCVALLVIRLIWKYYVVYINRAIEGDIKNRLFERITKIKLEKLQEIKNGEIMSYFVKDTNEVRRFIHRILAFATRFIATFTIVIFIMANGINLRLTLATMLPIIIAVIIIIKLQKYVSNNYKKAQEKFTEFSEYIQESTDSIRTTKAYSCEGDQVNQFITKNRNLKNANNKAELLSNILKSGINICLGLAYATSLIYGSQLVLNGIITVGELVTFNGYISLFVAPIEWLGNAISVYKRAQISYRRLDKVFKLDKEKITVNKVRKTENKLQGKIEIKNLTYHYPGKIENVLKDISISIQQGEMLGIIGTIGSGKTTLMNLLLKLYDVENGKIYIDDKDINNIEIETIRDNICYITQDNFLFSATLKENINLFRNEYEDDEIITSTKRAMIYDEISNMPNQIHTIIGEKGIDLSGGQKQRVVISRAFLNNSNIVIFDDTFSALDNRTEQKVLKNIKTTMKDKTCIIISNRISDVKISDKIIVLDEGRIIESGTHKELVNEHGRYYEFYMQQSSRTKEILI